MSGLGSAPGISLLHAIVRQNEIKIQRAADADMAEAQRKMLRALSKRLHAVVRQAVVRSVGAAWPCLSHT